MTDINLISQKKPPDLKEERLKRLRLISFVSLVIIGSFSILIFLVNIRLSINSIKREQEATIQSLSTYDKKATKLFILNTRVEDIEDIISHRGKYNEVADGVLSELSPSVAVQEMELLKESMSMTIASSSLVSLNESLNKIIALSQRKKFVSDVSIERLSIDETTRRYLLSIKAQII